MQRMAAAIATMQESHDSGDVPRFVEADLAFHEVLFEAADNAFLEALMQPLASVIRDLREETSSAPQTREHAIDFHGRILRQVIDRDTAGARGGHARAPHADRAVHGAVPGRPAKQPRCLLTAAANPLLTHSNCLNRAALWRSRWLTGPRHT